MTITLKFDGVEGKAIGYQGNMERATETYKEVRIRKALPIGQEVWIFDEPGGAFVLGVAYAELVGGFWEGRYHDPKTEFVINGTNGTASLLFG